MIDHVQVRHQEAVGQIRKQLVAASIAIKSMEDLMQGADQITDVSDFVRQHKLHF